MIKLHANFVFELYKGRVNRLSAHNSTHIFIDLITHGAAGYGTRIHQIMLDPDQVISALTSLL